MKNRRMVLDLLMIAVIATLYRKNVISLAYHEIMGLALGLFFVIHLFLNRKWIIGAIRNRAHLTGRVRALAWVDLLLMVSWVAATITGILVSKKVFGFEFSGIWIRLHFFTSAIALILTGIHLAMHRNFFSGFFKRRFAFVLLVIFTLAGFWGITRLNLRTWLSAPFISRQHFRPRDAEEGTVLQRGHEQERGQGHRHREEPFSLVGLLEVVFGTLSVLLVVNAGEYTIERLIVRKSKKERLT